MEQLTATLRAERRLLDALLFCLLALRGLVAGHDLRYVALAAAEVDRAAAAVREHEWPRTAAVEAAAARHTVPGDASIAAFARCAPAPFPLLLDEDHRTLRGLLDDIDLVACQVRAGARLGLERVDAALAVAEVRTDPADRRPDDGWDEELARLAYRTALVAAAGFPLPRLRAFLA